jgi:thiol-disulfide isomerase/thioredoxin
MTIARNIRAFAHAALVALALACSATAGAADNDTEKLKAGDMAPDIVGKTIDGQVVKVSQYAGKVVVVSFWATWCAYCLKELPILENLQISSAGPQIQVLAVNTEELDVFRNVKRGLKNAKMGVIYDPKNVGQNAYGVKGIPHMVIIGRDGRIFEVYRGYGESMLDSIVANINAALQVPAAEVTSKEKSL